MTEGNRGLWVLRGSLAPPAQEVPEETLVRWVLPEIPVPGAARVPGVTQALRGFRVSRAFGEILARKVIRAVKARKGILVLRVLLVRWVLSAPWVLREISVPKAPEGFLALPVPQAPPVPWALRV